MLHVKKEKLNSGGVLHIFSPAGALTGKKKKLIIKENKNSKHPERGFLYPFSIHTKLQKNRQVTRPAVWDTYGAPVVFSCHNTHHDWGQRSGAHCKQSGELHFLFSAGCSLLFKTPQLLLHLHLNTGEGKAQLSSEFVRGENAQKLIFCLLLD